MLKAKRNKKDDDSDYSDGEFKDLMDQKKIQEDIRMFYDRIHELINPIEPERLKLDSVSQIKTVVKTFYKTKQA